MEGRGKVEEGRWKKYGWEGSRKGKEEDRVEEEREGSGEESRKAEEREGREGRGWEKIK